MLPFLNKNKGWPTKAKILGESRYGYSEDDEIIEHALDEIIHAMDSKDHTKLMEALTALIELIRGKEHAPDTQQESVSI